MREKILIVDDDPETLALCQEALSFENYEVVTSTNGENALGLTQQEEFEVVLSDIRMPGMNGLELLESLKRQNPEQIVIMISGFTDVDIAVEAMKLGAFDSLAKPLIVDELKITVNKALRQNRLRQENKILRQKLQEANIATASVPKVIPILQNLTQDTARELLEIGKVTSIATNEIILDEGLSDNHLYLVFEGEISVWQEGAEILRLGKGECYGEMNLFRHSLRSQRLVAEAPTQLFSMEKEALLSYFTQKEERIFKLFVFNVLNSVFNKCRKSASRIIQLERLLKG